MRQLTIPSVGWTLIRAVLELTRDVDSVVCVALRGETQLNPQHRMQYFLLVDIKQTKEKLHHHSNRRSIGVINELASFLCSPDCGSKMRVIRLDLLWRSTASSDAGVD